jgi:hypothetical protein
MRAITSTVIIVCNLATASAFVNNFNVVRPSFTLQMSKDKTDEGTLTRRGILQAGVTASLVSLISPNTAFAGGVPPTKEELQRIKTGYDNIEYLLANYEAETTVCRENGGECKRDADPVRKYLGLRSTKDPLFQIEKVFDKVKYMDIDPDQIENFFEAAEEWNSAVNMSNSMAFISQFGEYNPGGGKDEVLKYLEEARKQVITAKGALKKIIDALGL